MNRVTIDSLRKVGMTALFLTLCSIAVTTLVAEAVIGADALPMLAAFVVLAAYPAWLWRSGATDRHARLTMAMALVAAPALSLYAFAGEVWQTDLHMIFFATLAMCAILCDTRAIIASTVVVAVHHLFLGMAVPDWVFYGGGGLPRILVHAVILLGEAAALFFLVQRIVALVETVQQQADAQKAADAAIAEERAARMAEIEEVTDEMGTALERLSRYDLSEAIEQDFPDAYVSLRTNFNSAIANLGALVSAVRDGTAAANGTSDQIARATDDLASRIESTAATVEEAFAALTSVRAGIEHGDKIVGTTLGEAELATRHVRTGRDVSNHAVQRMQAIAARADGIDDVIEGLDKIAFQTRVLAMNAAVEAGRAGEAGRGFAVVADLVGALAMRSEDEAKRAREQLSAIKDDMSGAVSVFTQVDTAFDTIAGAVAELHDRLSALAQDQRSQAQAIGQVSVAMSNIEQFVQQNSAMVEQTTAAARSLAHDLREVAEQAARFHTERGAAKARPRSFVPALPQAARALTVA